MSTTRIKKLEKDIAELNKAEIDLSKINEEDIAIRQSKQGLLQDIEKKKSLCQKELDERKIIESYTGKKQKDLSPEDKQKLLSAKDYINNTLPTERENIFGAKNIANPCISCIKKDTNKVERKLNSNMVPSEDGLKFLMSEEAVGFICPDGKVRAYQDDGCGKGNWTVGIGEFTGKDKDSEFDSEDEAIQSFEAKAKGEYSDRVKNALVKYHVNRKVTQQEFDALVSLAYNHGNCNAIAKKMATNETITEDDFVNITHGNHPELDKRRRKEFQLFSNQPLTVPGMKKFRRKDNTNGGYCPLKDDDGKVMTETVKVVKKDEKNRPIKDKKGKIIMEDKEKPVEGYTIEYSTKTYELNKKQTN